MRAVTKYRQLLTIAAASALAITCTVPLTFAAGTDKGKIAFDSDRTGTPQVYIMNPDGTGEFQVTNVAPDGAVGPTISPNGEQILFNYLGPNGVDIYVTNIDGTGLQPVTQDHQSFFPHWSPDGKKIVFTTVSAQGPGVIAVIQADGTGGRAILTTDLWDSAAPVYTPDGKQIVFQSQIGGYVSAVWIMNSDGSHQRRLTAPALRASPSAVSPDGKHILFFDNSNSPAALANENFVMNLNGSGLTPLAPLQQFHHDLYATYSPDGKKISFSSDRFSSDITDFTYGTFDILTMDATGGNIVDILSGVGFCPNDGNCVSPSWGPGEQ